jgi:hypothetical protein
VAQDQFRKDAQEDPDALFAAGFLQAHLGVTAQAAHKALTHLSQPALDSTAKCLI